MLKGAVVDFLQAIKVSEQLNPSQPSKTALFGKSFADAPVTLAQAVGQAGDLLISAVPTSWQKDVAIWSIPVPLGRSMAT